MDKLISDVHDSRPDWIMSRYNQEVKGGSSIKHKDIPTIVGTMNTIDATDTTDTTDTIKTTETTKATDTVNTDTADADGYKSYAYVVLLMMGDSYLPGCLTVAKSIRDTMKSDDIDIVCMVTNDVSQEAIIKLGKLYDHIFPIDYIEHDVHKLRTEKQNKLYEKWASKSFTKWRCMGLPYKKVLLLDADQLLVNTCDDLFELNAPAGCFISPYYNLYAGSHGLPDNYEQHKGQLQHGDSVPPTSIRKSFGDSLVVWGASILLPGNRRNKHSKSVGNVDYVDKLLKLLDSSSTYGHKGCFSMDDEQLITELFMFEWTNISNLYNIIPWQRKQYISGTDMIYHYVGMKPWDMKPDEYPDLKLWWDIYKSVGDV